MDEHLQDTRDAPAVPNTLLQRHEDCLLLAVDYHMAADGVVSFKLAQRSRRQHVSLRLYLRMTASAAAPVTNSRRRHFRDCRKALWRV